MQNMSSQQSIKWSQAVLLVVVAVLASVLGTMGAIKLAPQQMGVNQGAGIQALPQNPFIITMNDTTANRAINTVYRNLEGTTMIVIISIRLTVNGTSGQAAARFFVNQTSPPATMKARVNATINLGSVNLQRFIMILIAFVPDRFYYSLNSTVAATGSAVTIISWQESIPPTSFGLSIFSAIAIVREER